MGIKMTFNKLFIVLAITILSAWTTGSINALAVNIVTPPMNKMQGSRGASLLTTIKEQPMQKISSAEKAGLLKMREEEKLARDVYKFLGDTWSLRVFNNIVRAEQQHMTIVKVVLDKYKIADPVQDNTPGAFTDPEMNELYTSLIAKGKKSLIDALQVGMTIEDLDIKDLYEELEKTDNTDIKIVYQNLVKGSRNHMRAFMGQLSLNKGTYQAKYLSQKQIDAIVSSPVERGPIDAEGKPMTISGMKAVQ